VSGRPEKDAERRSATRYVPTGSLRAQLLVELDSSVLTLSSRGMSVRLTFAPPIGSRHEFVLRFGPRVLNVKGAVRNVNAEEPSGRGGGFTVGIEFLDLDPTEGDFLEQFVGRRLG
jgi:hypothetical protein